jgi:hypothetical protein
MVRVYPMGDWSVAYLTAQGTERNVYYSSGDARTVLAEKEGTWLVWPWRGNPPQLRNRHIYVLRENLNDPAPVIFLASITDTPELTQLGAQRYVLNN